MSYDILRQLVDIADRVDKIGFGKEARLVDSVIVKIAQTAILKEDKNVDGEKILQQLLNSNEWKSKPLWEARGMFIGFHNPVYIWNYLQLSKFIEKLKNDKSYFELSKLNTQEHVLDVSKKTAEIFDFVKPFLLNEISVRNNDWNTVLVAMDELKRIYRNLLIFKAQQENKDALLLENNDLVVINKDMVYSLNKNLANNPTLAIQSDMDPDAKLGRGNKKVQEDKYVYMTEKSDIKSKALDSLQRSMRKFMSMEATQSLSKMVEKMDAPTQSVINKEVFDLILMAKSKNMDVAEYLQNNDVPYEFAHYINDAIQTINTHKDFFEQVNNLEVTDEGFSPTKFIAENIFEPDPINDNKYAIANKTGNPVLYTMSISGTSLNMVQQLTRNVSEVVRQDFESALSETYAEDKVENMMFENPQGEKTFLTSIKNQKTYCSIDLTNICPKRWRCKACQYCYIERHRSAGDSSAKRLTIHKQYTNQLRRLQPDVVETLNRMGGLRTFNASDYVEAQFDELKRVFDDAHYAGLMVKVITKVPQFVEDFAWHPAIEVINVSVDRVGDGMNQEEAILLRKKYPGKVRIRCVAINPVDLLKWVDWSKEHGDVLDVITSYHGTNYAYGDKESRLFDVKQFDKRLEKYDYKKMSNKFLYITMEAHDKDSMFGLLMSGKQLSERYVNALKHSVFTDLCDQERNKMTKKISKEIKGKSSEESKKIQEKYDDEFKLIVPGLWTKATQEYNNIIAKFQNPEYSEKIKKTICCNTGACHSCKNHCGLGENPSRNTLYNYNLEFEDAIKSMGKDNAVKLTIKKVSPGSKISDQDAENIEKARSLWSAKVDQQNEELQYVKDLLKAGKPVPKVLSQKPYIAAVLRHARKKDSSIGLSSSIIPSIDYQRWNQEDKLK